MISEKLDSLGDYPFRRLEALVSGITPTINEATLRMSIGEPTHAISPLLTETLNANAHLWGKYPPVIGTPEFREATGGWLARRFHLPDGLLDIDRGILPVSGTREALFMVSLLGVPATKGGGKPTVLMPNPYYQVYSGGAVLGGAEPVYLDATAETGFLPDLDSLDDALLDRTALMFLTSPANPQGAAANMEYWSRLLALARKHDFILAADECYSEIYTKAPPTGALEAATKTGSLENLVVFHSLSKRSSAPGLRAGFIAGDPKIIAQFAKLRSYSVAGVPMPIMATAAALYNDETHVIESRALYQRKFEIATEIFGDRYGYRTPDGGFFLWLDVGDGEAATRQIWRDAGVMTLPGGYLAKVGSSGTNPGARYIRIALVQDVETTAAGLARIARVLEQRAQEPAAA